MKRLLAVLVAAGLVVGALVVRAAIDDDGNGGSGGDDREGRVVCAAELRDACAALGTAFEVTVEEATATADRLLSAEPDFDAWVVASPWPAMVDDARGRAGLDALFTSPPSALGRTRLAVVGPATLEGCDWQCLGERATDDVRLGSRRLASTGVGVLTVAAAAAGWFGSPSFATNDLDPEFDRWLTGFVDGIEPSSGPIRQLLQSRAFFDAAIDLEATAAAALAAASADRSAGLTLQYPAPVVTIEAVLASVHDEPASGLASSLTDALRDLGWDAPNDDPLGLPAPGVVIALRDRVR